MLELVCINDQQIRLQRFVVLKLKISNTPPVTTLAFVSRAHLVGVIHSS